MNNSIKQYLPSKKFIISISVLLGIVLIFVAIRIIARHVAKKTDPSRITVSNLMNPVAVDTDNDGVLDWEEALWGTDPKNPDSNADGIPDGVEIERKKNEMNLSGEVAVGEETETDKFAKDFYTTIAVAAQGGLTEQKSVEIQNDIAKYIVNKKPLEPHFTNTSFKVVANSQNASIGYISEMTAFFKHNPQIQNILETTTTQVKNGTIDSAYFKASGVTLMEFTNELAQMTVPQSVAGTHLGFMNALYNVGSILDGLSNIESDPLLAFSYGIEHQDALIKLSTAYANLGNYFTSYTQ